MDGGTTWEPHTIPIIQTRRHHRARRRSWNTVRGRALYWVIGQTSASTTPQVQLARRPKERRHFVSSAHLTGLYGRNRQPQPPRNFSEAEAVEIPHENDDPIFFRQTGQCSAQQNIRLRPLIFGPGRVAFISHR